MGYQDRDWYRDHLRRDKAAQRAAYDPRQFRRDRDDATSVVDPPVVRRMPTPVWLVVAALVFSAAAAFLKQRDAMKPVDSVLPPGVAAGRLHIVSRQREAEAVIELRRIAPAGTETSARWVIVVQAGASFDRDIPVGRYLARISRRSLLGRSPPVDFAAPIEIRLLAQGTVGTLQI